MGISFLGENWHAQIQQAIKECDFGLLLVSPAFLSSRYIAEHELPQFVNGQKMCMPVGLRTIDLANHDLRGLEDLQIFRYQSGGAESPRAFETYTSPNLQSDFALALFKQIKARLDKGDRQGRVGLLAQTIETSVPHNLPTLQPFFGREEELRKIADALDPDSRTWGALIDGPGGMGKTSLAVRAAYDAPPEDFEQIAFVSLKSRELDDDGERDLSGFLLTGLSELLGELARLLGHDDSVKAPEEQRPRLLLDALKGKKILLLLDNLESLTKKERDTLFTFIKRLPAGCKAILTSRGRIGSGAEELILQKLSQPAALDTLSELATHNPALAATSEAERTTLYNQTSGSPLLLRWTAGQIGRGSCLTFTDAIAFLRSCPPGNDPLEFIFGDLVEDFSPAEAAALCALSYFTLPAKVEHVAGVSGLSEEEAGTALRSLVNRSVAVPSAELQTFTAVPLVADFLRVKRPEVIAETGDRLEERALALIFENGLERHARFPNLDAAWPSVAPALGRFLTGTNALLQAVCDALVNFLHFTGRWDERLALCLQAEEKAIATGDYVNAGWRAYSGWLGLPPTQKCGRGA